MLGFGIVLIVLAIVLFILISNVKIVPQAHAYVVERLGGYKETWSVGLHFKVPMLDRVANESFGMYREALVWEMEKNDMTMLPKTKCLEITPNSVKIENADGVQVLKADTVLYALGMKSVDYSALKEAAGEAEVFVIGDAIHPGKVDQCTRTGYIAALKVGASEESVAYIQE